MSNTKTNKKLSLKEQFDSSQERRGGLGQNPPKPIAELPIPGADKPLRLLGNEEDVANLSKLVNRAIKTSPTALENIQEATNAGYTLEYTHVEGAGGECTQDGRFISLSPFSTEDRLIGTMTHEMRHAFQFENGGDEQFGNRDSKSELIHYRSMEADAQACATQCCWEMKMNGDHDAFASMKDAWPEIAGPYEKMAEKEGHENGKARTEAFKGWYDNDRIKHAYEKGYEVADMNAAMKSGTMDKRSYDVKMSAKEAVALTCKTSKGNYFTDNPDILESGKYLDVAATTKAFYEKYFDARKKETGLPVDKSVESIPVRKPMAQMVKVLDMNNKKSKPTEKDLKKRQIAAKGKIKMLKHRHKTVSKLRADNKKKDVDTAKMAKMLDNKLRI